MYLISVGMNLLLNPRVAFVVFPMLCAACFIGPTFTQSSPETAQPDNVTCQTNNVVWAQQGEHQWVSVDGLSVTLYPESQTTRVASTYFWNSHHAAEAYSLLEDMEPGEELHVTNWFRRVSDPWRLDEIPPECPSNDFCELSPYIIYYLHHPEEDWIIQHLITRAEGAVTSQPSVDNPSQADTHIIIDGPYRPVFEGQFRYNHATFRFAATEASTHQSPSTSERRFYVLQAVNNLLESCVIHRTLFED